MVINGVEGYLIWGDVLYLADIAKQIPRYGHYLEVGSWKGLSASIVAQTLISTGNVTATIHCVDTWNGSEEHQDLDEVRNQTLHRIFLENTAPYGNMINYYLGDSVDVAKNWSGPLLDVIYIDGDHSYDGFANDFAFWKGHLKPGGVMFGHDCVPGTGVHDALKLWIESGRITVTEAPLAHYMWRLNNVME